LKINVKLNLSNIFRVYKSCIKLGTTNFDMIFSSIEFV